MSPANLTFTSLPSADTCTRYTVTWNYAGPQQKFTLAVGPLSSQGVTSMYRILVTDVDATSQAWTWTSVLSGIAWALISLIFTIKRRKDDKHTKLSKQN